MSGLLERRSFRIVVGLVVPALTLIWWQWLATGDRDGAVNRVAFASLDAVVQAARQMIADGSLPYDIVLTLARALTGLVIGVGAGVVLGTVMALWRPVDRLLAPLFGALRQVPMIGWLPLLGLWFGVGDVSEHVMIALSAFFPALLGAYAGISQVEKRYVDVAGVLTFTTWQRFRFVLLPSAMPLLLTGLTQALAFAWISAIGTEILMGSGSGLGVEMQTAQTQQRLDIILVAIAVTAVLGFVLNQAVLYLRVHLLRWQGSAR